MIANGDKSVVQRRRWRLMIAYAIVLLPTLVIGASRALESNNNSPIDWVTHEFAPRAAYDRFCEIFGPGDTVVLSWAGCDIYDERLDDLVDRLQRDRTFLDADGDSLFFSVTSGRAVALALTAVRSPSQTPLMNSDQAIDRLRSSLVGADRRTTAVVITFTKPALRQRSRLVTEICRLVEQVAKVPTSDLHLAGPVIDGLSVDQSSQSTLAKYAAPSAVVVFLLCWSGLRSFRAAAIVFGVALFCQAATLALVHYSGESMSALMIVLPPMVQVLAVAGGLHLTNYYFGSDLVGREGAIAALQTGWAPCVLSAATTAVGMGSLMASQLMPIRQFGGYAAAGVLISVAVILGLLPAIFARTRLEAPRPKSRNSADDTPLYIASAGTKFLASHSRIITVFGLSVILVGGYYAAQIKTSVRIETLFSSKSKILADYAWIEQHIAPLVPLDIVLTFDRGNETSSTQKVRLLRQIEQRLIERLELSPAVSAATLSAPTPDVSMLPTLQQEQVIDQFLEAQELLFRSIGVVAETGDEEQWRLTVRTTALGNADYGELLSSVKQSVDSVLAEARDQSQLRVGSNVTGIMPLVHQIQGQLLHDLLLSFAGALLLITLTMTIVQAGVLSGLMAMASNVFPIAVYFGWLGWCQKPIDIGVVMTASVALGVAVDDTLHFLSFFQGSMSMGMSRSSAVQESLRRCAPAMIQTSVSCGLGLLVFALSDFAPTQGFAISMAVLLALALLGDLLLLPALLLEDSRESATPAK